MVAADHGSTWWERPLPKLREELGASGDGLTHAEARTRLKRYGLIAASVISALTGEVASFLIIIVMVLMSVTLDFVQEYRAGRAAQRLRQSVQIRATVLRGGVAKEVPVTQIMPGDVVLLSSGSLVPADGRLLEARHLFVNQALLTGESFPVEKRAGELAEPQANLEAATNALFMGTSVVSGTGRLLV